MIFFKVYCVASQWWPILAGDDYRNGLQVCWSAEWGAGVVRAEEGGGKGPDTHTERTGSNHCHSSNKKIKKNKDGRLLDIEINMN